jgi:hypothetical protein
MEKERGERRRSREEDEAIANETSLPFARRQQQQEQAGGAGNLAGKNGRMGGRVSAVLGPSVWLQGRPGAI